MNNKKHLDILTKVSIVLLGISAILGTFKIGPITEPIYVYVSDSKISTLISISSIVISLLLTFILIFLFLNKRITSFYQAGILLLLISLCIDISIGGYIIFSIVSVINIVVYALNLRVNKKGKLI